MRASSSKFATFALLLSIPVLFVITWLFPLVGIILGIIYLLFIVLTTSLMIFRKHRETYLQGRVSRPIFIRNASLEISGVLLSIGFAGLAGRYLAQAATAEIINGLTKLITGILIGLLVGLSIGIIIKKLTGYLIKTSLESERYRNSHLKLD